MMKNPENPQLETGKKLGSYPHDMDRNLHVDGTGCLFRDLNGDLHGNPSVKPATKMGRDGSTGQLAVSS